MTIRTALCCFVIIVFALALRAQTTQPTASETGKEGSVSQASKPKTGVDLVEGKVVKVESGDTVTVEASGDDLYQIKLQAIDAPDVGQPHFEESKNSLSKMTRGKAVRVVVHAMGPSGVMIGTVYLKGRDVGLSLLERGLAWHYKKFPYQQTSASRKTYTDAQNIASAAGLGIWASASPVPPWVFRGETASAAPGGIETGPANGESTKPPVDGRKYTLGPRGGCYYVSESGGKVYVQDKTLCGVTTPETKP